MVVQFKACKSKWHLIRTKVRYYTYQQHYSHWDIPNIHFCWQALLDKITVFPALRRCFLSLRLRNEKFDDIILHHHDSCKLAFHTDTKSLECGNRKKSYILLSAGNEHNDICHYNCNHVLSVFQERCSSWQWRSVGLHISYSGPCMSTVQRQSAYLQRGWHTAWRC